MRGFNYKKTVQALSYIATKQGGTINKMKAIKLIWLSDRFHLRNFGRTITGDTYFAFKFGPVPSTTRDILETSSFLSDEELAYSSEFIVVNNRLEYSSKLPPNLKVFSDSDISAINQVIDEYGKYDRFELSEISHSFPEWKRWEDKFKNENSGRFPIDFEDFFKGLPMEKPLFKQDEENIHLIKNLYFRIDDSAK